MLGRKFRVPAHSEDSGTVLWVEKKQVLGRQVGTVAAAWLQELAMEEVVAVVAAVSAM